MTRERETSPKDLVIFPFSVRNDGRAHADEWRRRSCMLCLRGCIANDIPVAIYKGVFDNPASKDLRE